MNYRAKIAAFILIGAATSGCVLGKQKGWVASDTRSVRVYTDRTNEHRFTQEWLEQSVAAYRAFFPDVKLDRVEVLWARSLPGSLTTFYSPLSPLGESAGAKLTDFPLLDVVLETVPGSGRIGRKGIVVMENDRWFNPFNGAERVAHLFINQAVPKAPPWLHVGLAQYMAGHRVHYSGKYWIACFGSRAFSMPVGGTWNTSGPRVLLPIDQVITADWFDYDQRLRNWFSFSSFALVHYLIHGNNGAHRPRFQILLRAMAKGMSSEEALTLAYPHLLPDEWDEELAKHIRPTRAQTAVTEMTTNGAGIFGGKAGGAMGAGTVAGRPTIAQGDCLRVPPLDYASDTPKRTPVDDQEIQEVMAALRRLPLNKRFSLWYPEEVVRMLAEPERGGAGRGAGGGAGEGRGGGSGKGSGSGGADKGNGAGRGGASPAGKAPGAPDPDSTPSLPDDGLFLRESVPSPAAAPPTPAPETTAPAGPSNAPSPLAPESTAPSSAPSPLAPEPASPPSTEAPPAPPADPSPASAP